MAKFELKFMDCSNHSENTDFIKCKKLEGAKDIIEISGEYNDERFVMWLDKSTSIKFAKTLRTEINKIQ